MSDESRFQLNRAGELVRVWRQSHEAMDPIGQKRTFEANGGSVMEHSSKFKHFRWPPKSPDMNIMEYIWYALQRAVQKRSPLPLTPTDLWKALQDSWCQLPLTLLQI
ncbi:transposable element tcb2 transposase [Trichonephila clavipes]|uniref:Transposable element tcb2 transposase n=1 Tax=Trichonephila clavipes TaxID=2585209 RepID=A0A8X6VND4_TRICX|nr:transposable element tcb2 transposase [Trichonephila clavipes]